MLKLNAALTPFPELGRDVFGDKDDLGGPADELVLSRPGPRCNKREHRRSVGRGDRYPAGTGRKAGIEGQGESQLVQIESQASVVIANEDGDMLKTEIGVLPIQAWSGWVDPTR